MKKTLIVVCILSSLNLSAQKDSLRFSSIELTVNKMFTAMSNSDSTMLRSVLDPEIRLQTIYTSRKSNQPAMHFGDVEDFISAVALPKDEGKEWNEKISNLQIEMDGNFAQVWMDYEFYLGEEYSHCGVNAMQLFWNGSNWTIFQITDTRRSKCDE